MILSKRGHVKSRQSLPQINADDDDDDDDGSSKTHHFKKRRRPRLRQAVAGGLFLAFVLVYAQTSGPAKRQLQRIWVRRQEFLCQAFTYPPIPWCPSILITPPVGISSDSIYYVTAKFGLHEQFRAAVEQVSEALDFSGLFHQDHIWKYWTFPDFILQDKQWKDHLEFWFQHNASLPSARGAGYWFWKGPLIKHHLKKLKEAEFLIYADVDLIDHLSWLPRLLEKMVATGKNGAIYELEFNEEDWTKADVLHNMCGERFVEVYAKTRQYSGNFLVLRKEAATMKFVDEWIAASSNFHWISDARSIYPNVPTFQEHRHDQSLISLLLKCKYHEPEKEEFRQTHLETWKVQMFHLKYEE
jgi:hypothetical protein